MAADPGGKTPIESCNIRNFQYAAHYPRRTLRVEAGSVGVKPDSVAKI